MSKGSEERTSPDRKAYRDNHDKIFGVHVPRKRLEVIEYSDLELAVSFEKKARKLENDNKIHLEKIEQLNKHIEYRDCQIKALHKCQENDSAEIAGLQKAITNHCREHIVMCFESSDHAVRFFVKINGVEAKQTVCAACKGKGGHIALDLETFRPCEYCQGKG